MVYYGLCKNKNQANDCLNIVAFLDTGRKVNVMTQDIIKDIGFVM